MREYRCSYMPPVLYMYMYGQQNCVCLTPYQDAHKEKFSVSKTLMEAGNFIYVLLSIHIYSSVNVRISPNTHTHTHPHTHTPTHPHTHTHAHTPGFDPWDVSNKGLADLLETEEKDNPAVIPAHQPTPPYPSAATNGGTGDGREEPLQPQVDPKSSSSPPTSWEEELRMLFPGVNISVGGTSLSVHFSVVRST